MFTATTFFCISFLLKVIAPFASMCAYAFGFEIFLFRDLVFGILYFSSWIIFFALVETSYSELNWILFVPAKLKIELVK